jgi:outer membrane protein assembly factor BamB
MGPGVLSIAIAWLAATASTPLGTCQDPDPSSWPQFKRDAARSGNHGEAVLEFPLNRITAVRFPAPIYASPAVAGDRVYIQDARGHVACIDAPKNKALWVTPIGGINNTSSPALHDGKVYVGSTSGRLCVLDAETGRLLREIPAKGSVIAAPAVANGAVYFATMDGALVKISLAGDVVWTYEGGRISTTEFAVRGDEIVFFAGTDNTVFHHLRDEGASVAVIARTPAPGQCCPVGGPVFVAPDRCVFQSFDSEYGRFFLLRLGKPAKAEILSGDVNDARVVASVRGDRIYRGDKCFALEPKPRTVWRTDPAALYDGASHSSPALARDVLAVGDERGLLSFFDLRDDDRGLRKPVWTYRTARAGEPNGAISSSPAVVAGRVFFGGEDGVLYGLGRGAEAAVEELPASEGATPAERLRGSEWPTPGGDMQYSYVSEDGVLKPPFQLQWKTRVWSSFKGPMIVADGRVYGTGRGGPLTALDAATGEILWRVHHPGVESRPAATFVDGKLVLMRVRNGQGDSPYVGGASGGPPGEGIWCHDAATGKALWHQPMAFRYHFNPDGLAAFRDKVFAVSQDAAGTVQLVAFALSTGREVWRRAPADLPPPAKAAKSGSDVKPIPAGLKLPPRFSGVIAGDLWCVSISDRGTFGVDPDSGEIAWSTAETAISHRSRVAARQGVLVVFTGKNAEAFDARTGKALWRKESPTGYAQALTDLYLESKGEKDARPWGRCWWPIFANGIWYSHANASSNNRLIASGPEKILWSYDFLSNACPSPSPAYGRLYYSPCGEGVIYCFRNAGP